jgi:ferredoxin
MAWGQRDELYFGRRDATTIIGLACPGGDKACFCTAVGLGPDDSRGSDVFLVPAAGGYAATPISPKGEAFIAAHAKRFSTSPMQVDEAFTQQARERVEANLAPLSPAVRTWISTHFQHELWTEIAQRCHGCGACASVCPTCHCFDIVDESRGVDSGERRRNWDTCQTGRFTVHASGHNPRADQNARFRQRVTHKFSIYPEKFGQILCTGCGRCSRACSAGMNLSEILATITRLASPAEPNTEQASSEGTT